MRFFSLKNISEETERNACSFIRIASIHPIQPTSQRETSNRESKTEEKKESKSKRNQKKSIIIKRTDKKFITETENWNREVAFYGKRQQKFKLDHRETNIFTWKIQQELLALLQIQIPIGFESMQFRFHKKNFTNFHRKTSLFFQIFSILFNNFLFFLSEWIFLNHRRRSSFERETSFYLLIKQFLSVWWMRRDVQTDDDTDQIDQSIDRKKISEILWIFQKKRTCFFLKIFSFSQF